MSIQFSGRLCENVSEEENRRMGKLSAKRFYSEIMSEEIHKAEPDTEPFTGSAFLVQDFNGGVNF